MREMPNLQETVYEYNKKQIKQYPCHVNRASALGHDCLRYLYHMRMNWQDAQPHDVELQRIFNEGNNQEAAVLRELADAGVDVIEQQTALSWSEFNITGHVDGVLSVDGKAVPLEIKSMHPNIWRGLFRDGARTYEWHEVSEGFQKKPWLRKYFAQLQVYMLCKNNDQAILLCKNKSDGALAQVNVSLDYAYAESLVLKAEAVNKAVDIKQAPARIPFDNDTCRRCEYNHLCCPDEIAKDPYQCIADETVAEWCEDDTTLAEAAKKRDKARKELLKYCKANKTNGSLKLSVGGRYAMDYNGRTLKVEKLNT